MKLHANRLLFILFLCMDLKFYVRTSGLMYRRFIVRFVIIEEGFRKYTLASRGHLTTWHSYAQYACDRLSIARMNTDNACECYARAEGEEDTSQWSLFHYSTITWPFRSVKELSSVSNYTQSYWDTSRKNVSRTTLTLIATQWRTKSANFPNMSFKSFSSFYCTWRCHAKVGGIRESFVE